MTDDIYDGQDRAGIFAGIGARAATRRENGHEHLFTGGRTYTIKTPAGRTFIDLKENHQMSVRFCAYCGAPLR